MTKFSDFRCLTAENAYYSIYFAHPPLLPLPPAMGLISLLSTPQNRSVGAKLLIATVAMFTLPLLTFFFVQDILGYPYQLAVALSVVVVNCVIAGYVYMAFTEEDEEDAKSDRETSGKDVPVVGVFKGGRSSKYRTD